MTWPGQSSLVHGRTRYVGLHVERQVEFDVGEGSVMACIPSRCAAGERGKSKKSLTNPHCCDFQLESAHWVASDSGGMLNVRCL